MAWTLSAEIEDALWVAVRRLLPKAARSGRVLREAIVARSRLYTSERDRLVDRDHGPGNGRSDSRRDGRPTRVGEQADLAARALFFTIADAAKIAVPLAELDRAGLLSRSDQLSILDVGAGVGAMTLGVMDYLRAVGALRDGLQVTVHAIDRDARALALMTAVLADVGQRFDARISLTTETRDLAGERALASLTGPAGRADLVLAGSVLNELADSRRTELVQAMLRATRADGSLVVLEPALRETARALHSVRDQLLEQDLVRVFAPCVRQAAPCPALAADKDWCHEDRPTSLSPQLARLAADTGLRTHGLKFSYLTVRHPRAEGAQIDASSLGDERAAARLVSQSMRHKGRRECFICSDQGRVRLRLLRRRRGPGNQIFEKARRGDVLLLPAVRTAGGDLTENDEVQLVRASEPSDRHP